MKKLIIEFDDEHTEEETIAEVKRLMSQGFTEGYYPHFYFVKEEIYG